jgi:hypothetical protein
MIGSRFFTGRSEGQKVFLVSERAISIVARDDDASSLTPLELSDLLFF